MTKLPEVMFPLRPQLPLPTGVSEQRLFDFVTSVLVDGAPPAEMLNYSTHDFRRFVYTYDLARSACGKCLELGANPYFTTMLLHTFTKLDLTLANYFGPRPDGKCSQGIKYRDFATAEQKSMVFEFDHFNIEDTPFPYQEGTFDVVVFAEIIEHLLNDPLKVLREIKRILKPGGIMILTTPNVARLENVARLIAGENIYDPYSGYGPYGRHNREYNRHELSLLLDYVGFRIEKMFTADVHVNQANHFANIGRIAALIEFRQYDLGQYVFIRAENTGTDRGKKPSFLYRSYPAGELE